MIRSLLRRRLSKPTWRAGARLRDAARPKHMATPKRWGQLEERYAFHYQYKHIDGERLLRSVVPAWAIRQSE